MNYFAKEESIFYRMGSMDYKKIIDIIANKYIADNPQIPFAFRAYNTAGIKCDSFGKYIIDFSKIYPGANKGAYAYAAAKIYAEEEGIVKGFSVTALGGVEMYINGQCVFISDNYDETDLGRKNNVITQAKKGWNTIFIKCKKLCDNYFGVVISGNSPKWAPLLFYTPFKEREGQYGFIYSNCTDKDIVYSEAIPDLSYEDGFKGLRWYPECEWKDADKKQNPGVRIFGKADNKYCLAWSKLIHDGQKSINIIGETFGRIEVYIDGKSLFSEESGRFSFNFNAPAGEHDIIVKGYDYLIETDAYLTVPGNAKGTIGKWLYLGLFDDEYKIADISEYQTLYKLFDLGDRQAYWVADAPNTVIRPCLENIGFGKWSYPYGVTLYGLIQAGRILGRDDIIKYVENHVAESVSLYRYTMWDKKSYGYPNINQQLSWYSALDDVGSFGSLMLEVAGKNEESAIYEDVLILAKDIADYIMEKLEKTEEGAFFRIQGDQRTLWADDLYMSVPFLARYYEISGDIKYLEEAAKQFILFKKYLWIEKDNIFSHVYDFRRNSKSDVPWGRGNGWVFFSLSELLEKMPKDFHMRSQLENMFREMTDGYMKLQGESGMWHQVLNDMTTYEETSSTSMIIYSLSRGVRMGIIPREKVVTAVIKAWEALTRYAVEQHGNIYGVCRGSGYSFDPEYYRNLSWNYNDTHGIGIVMLAGIEFGKMIEKQEGKNSE